MCILDKLGLLFGLVQLVRNVKPVRIPVKAEFSCNCCNY